MSRDRLPDFYSVGARVRGYPFDPTKPSRKTNYTRVKVKHSNNVLFVDVLFHGERAPHGRDVRGRVGCPDGGHGRISGIFDRYVVPELADPRPRVGRRGHFGAVGLRLGRGGVTVVV